MLAVGGCGSDSATGSEPVLQTKVYADGSFASGWPMATGSVLVNRSWRFFEAEEVEGGLRITGGYVIIWLNSTATSVTVEFSQIIFQDQAGDSVAQYDLLPEPVRFDLAPSEDMGRQGSFDFVVPDLAAANSITQLKLSATFTGE
jgi:hypothetical protein